MTWFAPLEVLNFARKAGFDNEQAKRAATVALVVSSGADHYRWQTPGVDGSFQSGLWGIPQVLVDEIGAGDQMSAMESAATARSLWRAHGNRWDWHPVVAADAGATVRRTLDALDLDNLWNARSKAAYSQLDALRKCTYTSKRTRAILARFPVT
jgi:hypothetical protein